MGSLIHVAKAESGISRGDVKCDEPWLSARGHLPGPGGSGMVFMGMEDARKFAG